MYEDDRRGGDRYRGRDSDRDNRYPRERDSRRDYDDGDRRRPR